MIRKDTVFAVQFDQFGSPDVLHLGEFPEPHAGPGQVRIRVRAAGVAPIDLAMRAALAPSAKTLPLPHVPGVDAAGTVDELGSGVTGVAVGDEVFGAVDISKLGGAAAEFAVLAFWAAKPDSMPSAEAGAAGTSIETATRVLDLLKVGDGQTVLIDGAAGGVGSVVTQLAIARGATVIGTASEGNQDFLAGLGATPVVYGAGLPDRVRALGTGKITGAIDISGHGSLADLIELTAHADRVLTIADFAGAALGVHVSRGELGGEPGGRHGLAEAARLFQAGRFVVPIQEAFPFAEAAAAHELAEHGSRRGKIVLTAP